MMSIANPAYGEKVETMTVTRTNAIKINVNIVRPKGAFGGAGSVISSQSRSSRRSSENVVE
jgi:hypothetical protein